MEKVEFDAALFSRDLVEWRGSRSMDAACAVVGLSKGTISRLERGLFTPDLRTFGVLCRAMQVRMERYFPAD